MQTRILGRIGTRSVLALLCVMSGGAALAQAGSAGMPGDGSAGSAGASKFAEMKVSVDASSERLVVVIPKLLKSVGADFIIDSDIKNAILSSHLTNVKLQTALDTLLRVSDIPVQYTFEKGAYHFSKRVEPVPETPLPKPQPPGEPVLPPLPTTVEEVVDVHNVQTYDLLRVLNGLFGVPVAIDPGGDNGALDGHRTDSGGSSTLGQGTDTGHGSVSSGSILGGRNGRGSQNGSTGGGMVINAFGHLFRIGNGH
ncbi:MAG: hypothetical protein JWL77_5197 [Chthonomonadaceae bacterium]|nr:hypothetical protein [Chthonomonadaceae bacterium]